MQVKGVRHTFDGCRDQAARFEVTIQIKVSDCLEINPRWTVTMSHALW